MNYSNKHCKHYNNILRIFIASMLVTSALAATFPPNTHYEVCFTPTQNCTATFVRYINNAKESIYMQAFSFTSRPIAHALIRAYKRGVKLNIIFDKSNFSCDHFSFSGYLLRKKIKVWDDALLRIAHNKVMIFDKKIVETGSFNFTKAAQYHNAENLLFIDDPALAKAYIDNWYRREKVSKLVTQDRCKYRYY